MKRISIEIRFFKCCGFESILSKNREILDTVKALNAGFYCLSSLFFFVVEHLIFIVFAYTKYYNIIVGKKVFL